MIFTIDTSTSIKPTKKYKTHSLLPKLPLHLPHPTQPYPPSILHLLPPFYLLPYLPYHIQYCIYLDQPQHNKNAENDSEATIFRVLTVLVQNCVDYQNH